MLVLLGCNLLWAGTYTAGKEALTAFTPVELNAVRFSIAGLSFLPLLWRQRAALGIDRRRLARLAGLCLTGFVLNKAFEFTGLSLTSASDNALLIASEGVFTAILGWVLLRERVRGAAVAGLLVSLAGVYLVIERGLVVPHLGTGTRVIGDLLIVAALLFEALYTVLGKAELERYPAVGITAACVIGSLLIWLPAAAVNIAIAGPPRLDTHAWLGVLYLAVAGTTVAYLGWIAALRHVDASAAAPTLFLQPFAGSLLAVVLLGERLTISAVMGGLAIVAGIWLVSRDRSREAPAIVGGEAIP